MEVLEMSVRSCGLFPQSAQGPSQLRRLGRLRLARKGEGLGLITGISGSRMEDMQMPLPMSQSAGPSRGAA
jgi:hypothetical protein